jgi:zinc protease
MKPARRRRTAGLAFAATLFASCSASGPESLASVLLPAPDSPMVHFRVLMKVGSANDPSGKEGLCLLTWNLLLAGGTRSASAEEIAVRLFPTAARLSVSVDKDGAIFSADVSRSDLEPFYSVFKDLLLEPGFREEDFKRVRAGQLASLEDPPGMEESLAFSRQILDRLVYEGYSRARPVSGTVETVTRFAPSDARVFYSQHFVRGNVIVGLAGGYAPGFAERVLADFRALPAGFTPALRLAAPRGPARPRALVAVKSVPAAAVSMGIPLDSRMTGREAAALRIAAIHLGQDRTARLMPRRTRRQRMFGISVPVGGDDSLSAIPAAFDALRSLVRDGIPEDRFDLVRRSLLNGGRLAAGGPADLLEKSVDIYGAEDGGDAARRREILAGLTKEEVDRFIRKYLDPERLCIAVVASDAGAALQALAPLVSPGDLRAAPAAEIFGAAGTARD